MSLEQLRAEHDAVFGESTCPQWVKDSLQRYVEHGIPTGDFLRAVLANDLQGAFGRADVDSARRMAAIAGYIYNRVPRQAFCDGHALHVYGSYEDVDDWIAAHLELRRRGEDAAGKGGA